MGKIANRFAQKRHPLFQLSTDLLKIAEKIVRIDEDMEDESYEDYGQAHDQIQDKLRSTLRSLNNEDFNKLQELLELNASARLDGEEELDLITSCFDFYSTNHTSPKNPDLLGTLIAIPLAIIAKRPSWEIDLTESKAEAITQAFQQYDLFSEDVKVCYVPRIFSIAESELLDTHTLFHMKEALRNGNNREAYRLAMQRRLSLGAGLPEKANYGNEKVGTTGIVIAYVESPSGLISPVFQQLGGSWGADDEDEDEDDVSFDAESAYEDYRDAMDLGNKACEELRSVFNVDELHLVCIPDDWEDSLREASRVERTSKLLHELYAAGFKDEDFPYLEIQEKVFVPEEALEVHVTVRDSRKSEWITLVWKGSYKETLQESVETLMGYLHFLQNKHKVQEEES